MDDHLGLRVGELVVIGIPEGVLTRAAVLAYLFPPAALVLAAGSAGSLGAGDLGSAFAGVLGLVLGLLATRAMTGGTAGRGRYRPVLVRRHLVARAGQRPAEHRFHLQSVHKRYLTMTEALAVAAAPGRV